MTNPALKNITALDMTEAMAGPYAGMMLGDLGADVIKIDALAGRQFPGVGTALCQWRKRLFSQHQSQ